MPNLIPADVKTATEIIHRTPRQIAWMRFKRNKVGVISLCLTVFFVVAAFFFPLILQLDDHPYLETLNEFGMPIGIYGGMSWTHPLGVEPGTGRDLLSLLLYGSRLSFTVALIITVLTIGMGMLIGIATGYFRGRVDWTIGRLADFLLSFPGIFMIIALIIPCAEGIKNLGIHDDNVARITVLVIFLIFFGWPSVYRIVRSQVMSLRERDFIVAAQTLGASNWHIIAKELLPNLWSTAIVLMSLNLPGYLATEAAFSYLGVGVQAPASSFGLVLSDSISYWRNDPAYLLITSIMLVVIVLALNLLGDAVRDALDPKQNGLVGKA